MSRRIEIELTSARPDGSWTWRVAGAKQPKGVVEGALLPDGAKVGDVLRADAEVELEGTVITTILGAPPKRQEPERLQLIGDNKPFEAVTTNLAPKGSRPKRDWAEIRPRSDRGPAGGGRPGPGGRPGAPGSRPGAPGSRPGAPGTRPERGASRSDRPPRTGEGPARSGETRDRTDASRPTERREGSRPAASGRERAGAGHRPGTTGERKRDQGPTRGKRLNPGSVHRDEVLASLAPEERPVAEQLLQGGIPAVRRAVQERNTLAREEGRPEVKADALLTLAEELLPRLKSAEWRDRADAAIKDIDEVSVRDLRSIVAGADAAARDDESRILAKSLREALDRREAAERDAWIQEVTTCLDDGKVTRALRVAGRPPDPRTRIPAEMTTRLSDAASAAMAPETAPERWSALLAAVLESPVRRSVKPVGLPAAPGEALLTAARQASGRIPALAAMLGLNMPPPPGPPRPGMRPPKPPARPTGAPRPPQPPAPPAEAQAPPAPPVEAEPAGAVPAEAQAAVAAPAETELVAPTTTDDAGPAEPARVDPDAIRDAIDVPDSASQAASPPAPVPDEAGSAIADQSPAEPAPASAEAGTPLDPATSPDAGPAVSPGGSPAAAHVLEAPHSEAAPPTPGGGTDDQPTPRDAARLDDDPEQPPA